MSSAGVEEWSFYDLNGEKLAAYTFSLVCPSGPTSCTYQPVVNSTNVWFAGQLIWNSGIVQHDRVGTNRVSGARFYPYGEEITSTANDREKFATYTRDSFTTLDYADQRYYVSGYGRFNTADPLAASAMASNPESWNRYAYAGGDPA